MGQEYVDIYTKSVPYKYCQTHWGSMNIGTISTESCKETGMFSSYLKYAILKIIENCFKIGPYVNDNGHMTSHFKI